MIDAEVAATLLDYVNQVLLVDCPLPNSELVVIPIQEDGRRVREDVVRDLNRRVVVGQSRECDAEFLEQCSAILDGI